MSDAARAYHHGDLRETLLAAAVAEVASVGAAAVSLREIARRAGVSHAAPAHHFGDKTGLFTAIAVQGFGLAIAAIEPAAKVGFVEGGTAYVGFALTHPGHFEVMFRPGLCRDEDPDLVAARDAAFAVLHASAAAAMPGLSAEETLGLVVAGWSVSHGFATLWLTANLDARTAAPPADAAASLSSGLPLLGRVMEEWRTAAEARAAQPSA